MKILISVFDVLQPLALSLYLCRETFRLWKISTGRVLVDQSPPQSVDVSL